jgi:Lhr-like helicase
MVQTGRGLACQQEGVALRHDLMLRKRLTCATPAIRHTLRAGDMKRASSKSLESKETDVLITTHPLSK